MDEAAINKNLAELVHAITTINMPLPNGQTVSGGIYESEARDGDPNPEESMDFLRIQVKYLMFDVEATRRENRYLRQLLENRPKFEKDMGDFEG